MTYKMLFNAILLILLFIGSLGLGAWIKHLEQENKPGPIIKTVKINKNIKRAYQQFPAPGICFEFEGVEIKANYNLNKEACK